MTRILLFLMKSIVALLASLGLLLVLTAAGGWFFWQKIGEWHSRDAKSLPDVVILRLDLADGLRDGPASGPLALAGLDSTPSIKNVIERLEEAAGDERVKGVVLRLGYGGLSPAQAQELRAALMRFRSGVGIAVGVAECFCDGCGGVERDMLAQVWD